MRHLLFDYRARYDNGREYNNDKCHRLFYFSRDIPRKFPLSARPPAGSPSLSRGATTLNFWRIFKSERAKANEGARKGEEEKNVFHFTYSRSSYDGNQHVDRRNARAHPRVASSGERHSTSSLPHGADRTCTESTPFSPFESRGAVNPRSPGRTSVNIDVTSEGKAKGRNSRGWKRESVARGPRERKILSCAEDLMGINLMVKCEGEISMTCYTSFRKKKTIPFLRGQSGTFLNHDCCSEDNANFDEACFF